MGAYIKVIIVVAILLWLLLFSGMVSANASDDRSQLMEYLYPIITSNQWIDPGDMQGAYPVNPEHIPKDTALSITSRIKEIHERLYPSAYLKDVGIYIILVDDIVLGYAVGATIHSNVTRLPDGKLRIFFTNTGSPVNLGWMYL